MEEFKELPLEALPSICRTCLVFGNLYLINEIRIEGVQLTEILSNCASIQVEENSKLPHKICKNCIKKCYEINRFLKNCKKIETFLNDLLKSTPKGDAVKCELEIVNEKLEPDLKISTSKLEEAYDSYDDCDDRDDYNTDDEDEDYVPPKEETEISDDDNNVEIVKAKLTPKNEKTRLKVKSSETPPKRVKLAGPPFVCETCNLSFDQYIYIRKHWQLTHHRPKYDRCPYCPRAFSGKVRLQQHIRTHTGEKPNTCNICGKSFNQKSAYNRHMYTHSNSKRHKCNDCGAGFERVEYLNNHKRRYHTGEKLLCPYCGKGFTSIGILKAHEKQHVGMKPDIKIDPNIPFQCKTCGKILISEDVLNEHMKRHNKQKRIYVSGSYKPKEKKDPVCEHCKAKYDSMFQVRAHQRNSQCGQYVNTFSCSQCGKSCASKASLYAHLRLHKDDERDVIYECEFCGEQFDKERKFKQHISKHTRKRRFICTECGVGFFTLQHLKNHSRTHTGEKPFVCDVCTKAFALKVNLTVHKRIHLNIKPFKCEICSHDFRDSSTLRKHSKRCHGADFPIEPPKNTIMPQFKY